MAKVPPAPIDIPRSEDENMEEGPSDPGQMEGGDATVPPVPPPRAWVTPGDKIQGDFSSKEGFKVKINGKVVNLLKHEEELKYLAKGVPEPPNLHQAIGEIRQGTNLKIMALNMMKAMDQIMTCSICYTLPMHFQNLQTCVNGHFTCNPCLSTWCSVGGEGYDPENTGCPVCRVSLEPLVPHWGMEILYKEYGRCRVMSCFRGCGAEELMCSLARHERVQCPKAPKTCPLSDSAICYWRGTAAEFEAHVDGHEETHIMEPNSDREWGMVAISGAINCDSQTVRPWFTLRPCLIKLTGVHSGYLMLEVVRTDNNKWQFSLRSTTDPELFNKMYTSYITVGCGNHGIQHTTMTLAIPPQWSWSSAREYGATMYLAEEQLDLVRNRYGRVPFILQLQKKEFRMEAPRLIKRAHKENSTATSTATDQEQPGTSSRPITTMWETAWAGGSGSSNEPNNARLDMEADITNHSIHLTMTPRQLQGREPTQGLEYYSYSDEGQQSEQGDGRRQMEEQERLSTPINSPVATTSTTGGNGVLGRQEEAHQGGEQQEEDMQQQDSLEALLELAQELREDYSDPTTED